MDDRGPDERLREVAVYVCGWLTGRALRARAGLPMPEAEDLARVAEILRRPLADLGCPVGPPVWTPPDPIPANGPDLGPIDAEVT